MDPQHFLSQTATPAIAVGSRAARGQITIAGTPNRLNYWLNFIEHT